MKRKIKLNTELFMLLPVVVILGIITIYPFIFMIKMSFMKYSTSPSIPTNYIGGANWVELFHDKAVGNSWITMLIYYASGISSQLVLGIAIALLIDSLPRGQSLFSSIVIIPMFLAPVLVGLLWKFLLHDAYGPYAYYLHQMNLFKRISILGNTKTALPCMVIMDTWEWTPLITLIILAGLKSLPTEIVEASLIDGASYLQQLRYIIFPFLKQVILVALFLRTMDLFRFYTKILVTTGGGPADATKIVAIRIFENGFRFYRLGYASAIGLTLLLSTVLTSEILYKRVLKGI